MINSEEFKELALEMRALNKKMQELDRESDIIQILCAVQEFDALREKIFDFEKRLCKF